MFLRLWIYSVCALIVAGLFLFNPAFNWGGIPGVSLYFQSIAQGQILTMLGRSFVPAIIVFIGLLAYFGLGSSKW
jgi:hypothetical protein